MVRRMVISFYILSLIILTAKPGTPVKAALGPEFFAAPSAAMPGAVIAFSGYGFSPNDDVNLLFMGPLEIVSMGFLPTDSAGAFSGLLQLPAPVDPGTYQVLASPQDVFASVTILPGLTLSLSPGSGPPGTIVHFTVNNLTAGQLRLDYDGVPVYGPVDVTAGLFEGDFLVPADRPSPLGTDAEVKAVNRLGSATLGEAYDIFGSQEINPDGYSILGVELPPDGVEPGFTFTITGLISPPPVGPLTNYELKILWKSFTGQVVPITVGTPQIESNGSFSAQARAPSLLAGDPLVPETGGQIGVVLFDLGYQQNSVLEPVPWLSPADPVFKVKVVDPNGTPIVGALVDVRAFYSDFGIVSGETTSGTVLQNNVSNLPQHPNQITSYLGPLNTSESDSFTCEQTNVYGRTDINGIFEVKIDPASLSMLGKQVFLDDLPKPTYIDVPMEIEFPLYVNALHKGFGAVTNSKPEPYKRLLRFSGLTHLFYDAKTNQVVNTNPIVVTLPPLAAGTKITLPVVPKVGFHGQLPGLMVGHADNWLGTQIPMTAFGKFYSFPAAQFPSGWFVNPPPNVYVEFQHDPSLFGTLDEDNLKFTLNGQVYKFFNVGKKYEGNATCQSIVYRATLPAFYRYPAGFHVGLIEIRDKSFPVNITRHYIQLNVFAAPTWVLQPQYKERKISFAYSAFLIRGFQYPPGGPSSTSNLDTVVPKIGPLENRVRFGDEVSEMLYPDKTTGMQYKSQVDGTVTSENTGIKEYGGTMAGGKEIVIPSSTITVLDTGKIPLYRHVIGIPPIAGVTLGADMWIDATMTTSGKIQFLSNGTSSTSLLVYPDATIGVDAFLNGEVLFGLASASAHATPDIGLGMPATFVNGGLQDSSKCFHYKLVLSWSAKIGICPLCKKYSDSETIFNDRKPPSCAPPPAPSTALNDEKYLTAVIPEPPTASPSLAVDGLGHTLLVWSDESNNIQSKVMSGGSVLGQVPITSNMRGIDPQVAFYAPNQAVAVWTESSLAAAADPLTTTIEQFFQAQHLKYALWNGTTWGPSQNLTLPADSNGEGSVVLAGCLSTKASCGATGAVTAVWVRDMGAAYSQRSFRLFYAVFDGTTWSSAQAVDPASTGTDAEAVVVYSPSGIAQVAWSRDGDRNLSTVNDRRLVHRQLSGGAPVNVLTMLPAAAVEPSLAVNNSGELSLAFTVATDPTAFMGNQRQLHAARQTCGESGCTWAYNPLVDIAGRPVHAESPSITINAQGQAQITYRALGFGPAGGSGPIVLKGDPLGTIIGTGEIAQTFVTVTGVASATISPSYQTTAGNTVWQTNSVFDPVLDQVYIAASQGSGPSLPVQALEALTAQGYDVSSLNEVPEPLALLVAEAVADFSVADVTVSTPYIQTDGNPLSVTVTVLNNGPTFVSDPDFGFLDIKLAWDAPVGLGVPAGEVLINIPIEAGGVMLAEFSVENGLLTLPAFPHLAHTLYVQINSSQLIAESDYENNVQGINLGGLPAPQGLTGVSQPGDSSVFLEWQGVEHEAVSGYRIYRSSDGNLFTPVGSSFAPGFVDLSGVQGETYLYTVVSYAQDGFESGFSTPIQAMVGNLYPVFLPIITR